MRILFSLLFCFLLGCSNCPEKVPPFTSVEIPGREETAENGTLLRRPLYHAKVPNGWEVNMPTGQASLIDTKIPNAEFWIDEKIRITVHSFSYDELEERIPPIAQIERWKNQLKSISEIVENVSRSGFAGLFIECRDGENSILGWSMQLDPGHFQTLSFLASNPEEKQHYKQMRSDYTIKATGPSHLIEKHKEELLLFANSFELIQEIPSLR